MKYQEQSVTTGAWVKAAEIPDGTKAKIVSETKPQPSAFKNKDGSMKMQDVCKVRCQGHPEAMNLSLNKATIGGLIRAFGDDSTLWMNKVLTVQTEKMRVSGKAVTALYLIPEGFKRIDDENGYAVIVSETTPAKPVQSEPTTPEYPEEEVNVDDIPF